MNWDRYRYFLAVANCGSLSAAARSLKVSQPTVGRQINELEIALGTRLFQRESHGYSLTPVGQQIYQNVRNLSFEFSRIERLVEGSDSDLSGTVRIAATEGFGGYWLTGKLVSFQHSNPQIHIELLLDQAVLSENEREADLRIRFQSKPREDEEVFRLGHVGFGLYASSAYIERHGSPATRSDLQLHKFVDWKSPAEGYPLSQELAKYVQAKSVTYRTNRFSAQVEAAVAGLGLILAPHYVADRHKDLKRVLSEEVHMEIDAWLYSNRDMRHTLRVQRIREVIVQSFEADQKMLRHG